MGGGPFGLGSLFPVKKVLQVMFLGHFQTQHLGGLGEGGGKKRSRQGSFGPTLLRLCSTGRARMEHRGRKNYRGEEEAEKKYGSVVPLV